jgi:hypothetical protein
VTKGGRGEEHLTPRQETAGVNNKPAHQPCRIVK